MNYLTSALVAFTLLAPSSLAQDPTSIPDNSAEMKRLAWLAGAWEGKGEMPGYGKYTFTYVLTWTMSKNFLKAEYQMKVGDKIMWQDTGMLGWDKDKKKFMSFVFGMDGTIGHAAQIDPKSIGVKPHKGKQSLALEGQTSGNSPWKRFRTIILQADKDTLEIETQVVKAGKWVSLDKSRATRTPKKKKKVPSRKGN